MKVSISPNLHRYPNRQVAFGSAATIGNKVGKTIARSARKGYVRRIITFLTDAKILSRVKDAIVSIIKFLGGPLKKIFKPKVIKSLDELVK